MKFSAIIFDLDGTLLDTIDDLTDSLNSVLERRDFPTHNVSAYKLMVGDGVEQLVRRALPQGLQEETVKECVKEMRAEYGVRWDKKTKPYPGIPEMLDALKSHAIPMAILSNKPDDTTHLVVAKMLPRWSFASVRGARVDVPKKPDPTGALEIAAELRLPPQKILYVGDSCIDMRTAVSAGMYPLGVLWGFRDAEELLAYGAKRIIDVPNQLLTFFR